MKTILFPSKYMNIHEVDSNFLSEYNTCISLNIPVALFDHDIFISENKLNISTKEGRFLLRSWMLKEDEYRLLTQKINLVININQYIHAHHYPNIHKDIVDYATDIISFDFEDMTDSLINKIQDFNTNDVLIKDYVKSEKG
jgi:hypothetical protein